MAYKKIIHPATYQGTWSELSVTSWITWLGLDWNYAVSLSGYMSKCGYEPVLRPSENFVFSNIHLI